jgi:hypothetical protein
LQKDEDFSVRREFGNSIKEKTMAAQPLNTEITIFRTIRSFRQAHRHESVAALIKHLRPLVMSIPAHEILVGVLTRDTNTKDFSPYCGEARHTTGVRGFPIVVGLKGQTSFARAQTEIADIDFAYQIGADFFLQNTVDGLDNDLHEDARDVTNDM